MILKGIYAPINGNIVKIWIIFIVLTMLWDEEKFIKEINKFTDIARPTMLIVDVEAVLASEDWGWAIHLVLVSSG